MLTASQSLYWAQHSMQKCINRYFKPLESTFNHSRGLTHPHIRHVCPAEYTCKQHKLWNWHKTIYHALELNWLKTCIRNSPRVMQTHAKTSLRHRLSKQRSPKCTCKTHATCTRSNIKQFIMQMNSTDWKHASGIHQESCKLILKPRRDTCTQSQIQLPKD